MHGCGESFTVRSRAWHLSHRVAASKRLASSACGRDARMSDSSGEIVAVAK